MSEVIDVEVKEEFVLKQNIQILFEDEYSEMGAIEGDLKEFLDIKGYQATSFADVAVFVVQTKDDRQFIYKMNNIKEIVTFISKE